eukprot:TRINITY_DN11179_c0_g1_i1.p1 TRINITY_DN11179_c0_g1~~TRINITY_DN11179_c0_g1_i1.p1  ORF type:complete len:300 (+),score=60.75 TRINITY_DN11179_c0_g1_i1:30-929(+)
MALMRYGSPCMQAPGAPQAPAGLPMQTHDDLFASPERSEMQVSDYEAEMANALATVGRRCQRWERLCRSLNVSGCSGLTPAATNMLAKSSSILHTSSEVFPMACELLRCVLSRSSAWTNDLECVVLSCLQVASKHGPAEYRLYKTRVGRFLERCYRKHYPKEQILTLEYKVLEAIDFSALPSPLTNMLDLYEVLKINCQTENNRYLLVNLEDERFAETMRRLLIASYHHDVQLARDLRKYNVSMTVLLRSAGPIAATVFVIDMIQSNAVNSILAEMTGLTVEALVEYVVNVLQVTGVRL